MHCIFQASTPRALHELTDSEDSEEEFPDVEETTAPSAPSQPPPAKASTSAATATANTKGTGKGSSAKRKLIPDDDAASVASSVGAKRGKSDIAQVLEGRSEIYRELIDTMAGKQKEKASDHHLWAKLLANKLDRLPSYEAESFKVEVDGMVLHLLRRATEQQK